MHFALTIPFIIFLSCFISSCFISFFFQSFFMGFFIIFSIAILLLLIVFNYGEAQSDFHRYSHAIKHGSKCWSYKPHLSIGSQGMIRTCGRMINSHLLYQLSYLGINHFFFFLGIFAPDFLASFKLAAIL